LRRFRRGGVNLVFSLEALARPGVIPVQWWWVTRSQNKRGQRVLLALSIGKPFQVADAAIPGAVATLGTTFGYEAPLKGTVQLRALDNKLWNWAALPLRATILSSS
jgi:hypothetical protein